MSDVRDDIAKAMNQMDETAVGVGAGALLGGALGRRLARKFLFRGRVRLRDAETGQDIVYRIRPGRAAQLEQGAISSESPIAKAVMGKQVGDEVRISVPGRGGTRAIRRYEVVDIKVNSGAIRASTVGAGATGAAAGGIAGDEVRKARGVRK